MSGKIQVGYLVSYDYELLKNSLPTIYKESDTIFLAIDKNRKTWKGDAIEINPDFFDWIKAFDVDNKTVIYEDDFYVPTLTTMQCEVRERKMLSAKMGIGNWLIQIDADEYFVDFKSFISNLRKYDSYLKNPKKHPIQFCAFWIMLYKYTPTGILYVDKPLKAIFATNYPEYSMGRRIKGRQIYTNNIVLHESLSRSEEDLRFKLENWGHNVDVHKDFLSKWLKVDESNYMNFTNFYYLQPERWKRLGFFPTKDISKLKKIIQEENKLNVLNFKLFFKNFGQWFKYLIKS
ncbi:hypothetical protein [Flavobacterium soyangense]|uniref:Uncharacterized protein n=1 Tax=Flavobacterium soyangense TaxID=2023265 RepID=A0A930UDK0_9FLAO|nr:hypothetical protein [Flavobacterium soyangense]MBF2708897.1 hypothetical protein [Flavobacterium soyangense]